MERVLIPKLKVRLYAKKFAKEHKMDIGSVVGTGLFGRITAADVEAKAGIAPSKSTISAAFAPASSTAAAPPPPKASSGGSGSLPPPLPGSTVVPFTTMQAAVSKNMVESLSVPTFYVCYPVTTDALDALYEKILKIQTLILKFYVLANKVVKFSCLLR